MTIGASHRKVAFSDEEGALVKRIQMTDVKKQSSHGKISRVKDMYLVFGEFENILSYCVVVAFVNVWFL